MATSLARRNLLKLDNFMLRAGLLKLSSSNSDNLCNKVSSVVGGRRIARNFSSENSGKGSFLNKLLGRNISPHTDAHSKTLTESLTSYEIQFHYVKPECMGDYLALVSEAYPKILHAEQFPGKLIGSWTTQYGELDQVVHLWAYTGGYKAVTGAKNFLSTDQEFLAFAKQRNSFLRRRENQLLHEFSFWSEPQFRDPSHVYELRSYSLKPGTLIEWGNNWGNAIKIRQEDAVAGFFSQIGDLYEVHHLWAYKDLDHRKSAREEMWQEPGWGECVANTVPLINSMRSRLLIPTSYSPTQ